MHEAALAADMIEAIAASATREAFTRVRRVILEIGAFGCVDPRAMMFCFDAAASGTLVEGAVLEIVETPGQARCFGCEADVVIEARGDPCPACGSHQLVVTGGTELKIKALEVD